MPSTQPLLSANRVLPIRLLPSRLVLTPCPAFLIVFLFCLFGFFLYNTYTCSAVACFVGRVASTWTLPASTTCRALFSIALASSFPSLGPTFDSLPLPRNKLLRHPSLPVPYSATHALIA
mmetsp:Transcript_20060/g.34514  ORF Transcript_20060/g.34514 Transcript_20060/m.34514 type:complete len:120 (-) Transcript_20060:54-413(-)